MGNSVINMTLTSDDSFSDVLEVNGNFNFGIVTTAFEGTVTLQRKFNSSEPWKDVNNYTDNFEGWDTQPNGATFRAGIKPGDYTSGIAYIRLSN